jgi:WD repeat-containing protein 35
MQGSARLVAIEWYDGGGSGGGGAAGVGAQARSQPSTPALALALDNGRLQLMAHASDDSGVCVDTGLRVAHAKWSRDGAVRAPLAATSCSPRGSLSRRGAV